MDARSIIAKLRRREVPGRDELNWFAQGLADGGVSDAQAGAFAMAVCMGGLGVRGRADLTIAMRDSGEVLNWDLDGPVIDKHSTGGVGDCVSLVLVPALAECGACVPMISGRGLGHTGGTLDKLEAIPGVTTRIGQTRLARILKETGAAIVGATGQIAPADKRLYAVRDVTATVESLDLITASILSKKLAASPDALVLDVKMGSGAFMKTLDDARQLARGADRDGECGGMSDLGGDHRYEPTAGPGAGQCPGSGRSDEGFDQRARFARGRTFCRTGRRIDDRCGDVCFGRGWPGTDRRSHPRWSRR